MEQPCDANDQLIAQLIAEGDPDGIAGLLQAYGGRVSSYLKRKFPSLGDHGIHDALVDAVISVGQSFDAQRGTLAAWFLFLAHQAAVKQLRACQNNLPTESSFELSTVAAGSADQPVEMAVQQEQYQAIQKALELLSTLERAVIEADLEAEGSASADELARQFRTTPDSVYSARLRARKKLSRSLDQVFGLEENKSNETRHAR